MSRIVVVVGDALVDRDIHGTVERVGADAPVPVGAGLAASLIAAGGAAVTLVTALAGDRGRQVAIHLLRAEIDAALGVTGPTPSLAGACR